MVEKSTPKVSVIIPVYKVEQYLNQCIESIRKQTLTDIEIILIDDESPDRCPAICEELAKRDSRIKVIHKKNGGLGMARNSGLDIARGEYISFIDSDDYVDLSMLERLYCVAVEENADHVFAGYYRVFDNKILSAHQMVNREKIWRGENEVKDYLLDLLALPSEERKDSSFEAIVWKGIFKKETIDRYNLRFVSEREFIAEDVIWDIDFFVKAKCVIALPDLLYYYRYNSNSLTGKYKKDRFIDNKKLYFEIERKIGLIYKHQEYEKRIPRYFLTTARIALLQEGEFRKQNGYRSMYKMIKKIVNDDLLQMCLEIYPYEKMCMKYHILFAMMKKQRYICVSLLVLIFVTYRNVKRRKL